MFDKNNCDDSTKYTCVSFHNQANVRSNSCREERKDQCHNSQLAKITSTKAGGLVPVFHRDENLSRWRIFAASNAKVTKIICSRLIESYAAVVESVLPKPILSSDCSPNLVFISRYQPPFSLQS